MLHDLFLRDVESLLKSALILSNGEIGVRLDQKPPATAGQFYLSIFPGPVLFGPSLDQHEGMELVTGFAVGMTLRTANVPDDRMYKNAYEAAGKLCPLARKVYQTMRENRYKLMGEINSHLPDEWEYVEPFRFGDSPTQGNVVRVGPDHFSADPGDTRSDGVLMVLEWVEGRFMRAIRV